MKKDYLIKIIYDSLVNVKDDETKKYFITSGIIEEIIHTLNN